MNNLRRRALLSSSINIDPTTGRGTIGDYEVVDLGLPSGLLWATCNVGATNETEYGDYYQWGAGVQTYQNVDQYHAYGSDSTYTLPSSADTATQVMDEGWRMPTLAELTELTSNTTNEWATINGVNGGKFTSKTNPNAYVFFPAAGYYNGGNTLMNEGSAGIIWSSTPYDSMNVYYLYSDSWDRIVDNLITRRYGFSVRGVHAAV